MSRSALDAFAARIAGYGPDDTPCEPRRSAYTDDLQGYVAWTLAITKWETFEQARSQLVNALRDEIMQAASRPEYRHGALYDARFKHGIDRALNSADPIRMLVESLYTVSGVLKAMTDREIERAKTTPSTPMIVIP